MSQEEEKRETWSEVPVKRERRERGKGGMSLEQTYTVREEGVRLCGCSR